MTSRRKVKIAALAGAVVLVGGGLVAWAADREYMQGRRQWAEALTGGKPERAEAHMLRFGCAGCHDIPGVPGPAGLVGPPLADVGKRVYIAGVLPNTPQNMVQWILDPPAVDPKTAMPVTGISEPEARDVAAYLYSLR